MAPGPTFTTRAIALAMGDADRAALRGTDRWLHRALRLPLARRAFRRLVDLHVPGTSRHLAARKAFFSRTARTWLEATPDATVFVLGAGLDGLGGRLQREFEAATVHEFDRTAARVRGRGGGAASPRVHEIDLATADLRFPATDRPLLVLAEGVFMYLEPSALARVMTALRAATTDRAALVFSFLDAHRLEDPRSPIARLRRRLEPRGEPFRWSLAATDLTAWLAATGWRPTGAICVPDDYGECFARAERSPS